MTEMEKLDATWNHILVLLRGWPEELYMEFAQDIADVAELRNLERWHERDAR